MTETLAAAIRLHMLGRRFGNGFSEQDAERLLAAILPSAPPALDVDRLALALANVTGIGVQDTEHGREYDTDGARRIAAEYARLEQDR